MKHQKIQIKLAQLNLAMRHVLRNRMQKQAEASVITDLKKDRDRSLLMDILGGAGKGGLIAGTGTALAYIPAHLSNGASLGDALFYNTLVNGPVATLGGATLGGLYRGLTHNSRKQKAIDKLKELGVESNE